ncbi:MAG TPA: leucine-rich repeat domain-containing protein, partial [Phycisphaerae bacterium]|nr:leucine-rich repeat domain-containing protein [Phycisphaerae bacterium]
MTRPIALPLSVVACLCASCQGPSAREEKAVQAIEALGGQVTRDEALLDRPVVEVDLSGIKVTDAGLKVLKEFKDLQELNLSHTQITDAGLRDLRELKGLQALWLSGTQITDVGLKVLKELKDLQSLDLGGTKITDAGLKDLKEL